MSLPSINQLFIDSWQLLKQTALNLFLLSLLSFGLMMGTVLIIVILAILFGAGAVFSTGSNPFSNPAQIAPLIASFGFLIFLGTIVLIIVSLATQIATVFVLSKASEKPSVFQLFKQSFPLMLPLIGISLITSLLSLGGMFLLIIPGIVISLLLSFSVYELILNNQRGLAPLRRSFYLVSSNFWSILGRLAILWLLSIVFYYLFSLLTSQDSEGSGLSSLIAFIFNTVIGWFTACYTFVLYKQVVNVTPSSEVKKLTPIVITSVIGWVLGALILVSVGKTAVNIFKDAQSQRNLQNIKTLPPVNDQMPFEEGQMPTQEEIEQLLREATAPGDLAI